MANDKCSCGGNMIAVWDLGDEISRIKCDSSWHSSREPDLLEALLGGDPGPQPDVMAMSPAELKALYEHEEDD